MNKTKVILVAACFLLTAVTLVPTTLAHSESDPMVRTLLAGQDINAGTVSIWNDGTNLHVVYDADNGWVITGTHLYVGKTNPNTLTTAPGQFPYSGETEYVIPLSTISAYTMELNKNGKETGKMIPTGTPGVTQVNSVYIAAHADVKKETYSTGHQTIVSNTNTLWTESSLHTEGTTTHNTVAVTQNPAWASISGATWIWISNPPDNAFEYANVPLFATGQYGWKFTREVTLPSTAYDVHGNIKINSDNAYKAWLNSGYLGGDGAMGLDGPDTGDYVDAETYGFVPHGGSNTITIRALNYYNWNNPAGLAYKAEICYKYDYNCQKESAWACGTQFNSPNWAMYFQYGIQGWELIDHVHVSASASSPTISSINFVDDELYKLVAIGTANAGDGIEFDAKYSFRTPTSVVWTDAVSTYESYGPQLLDLYVNGINVNWGAYTSTHMYNYYLTGTGSPVTFQFQIYDTYPQNNAGELIVYIYQWA